MSMAGEIILDQPSWRLASGRSPVNFALGRHGEKRQLIWKGLMARGEGRVPGRRCNQHRLPTSPLRNEPASPARWQANNEDHERAVRFLATRSRNEPCSPRKPTRSRSTIGFRATRFRQRSGVGEARWQKRGLVSDAVRCFFKGRPNETLHRTSARGLPCERLARLSRIEHLLALIAGACR